MTQHTRRHLDEEEEEPKDPFFRSCTFCGKLNVPFLSDKLLPFFNITCQELQDEYFSFIPKEHPACNRALTYEYHCCDQSSLAPRYECEDTVRNTLLKTDGYNIRTAPVPQETRQLDVSVEMKYWYLENVDVTASTFRALMQIDLTWNDPRLRWDASDATTCVSFIDVYASHDPERSEIWVPDFDLLNKASGVQGFPDTPAIVYSDGTVTWSRQGSVTALCTFVGLRRMPFDRLGCQLHFGGKLLNHLSDTIHYSLERDSPGGGLGVASYTQSYTEYSILGDEISCDYYDSDPSSRFHCQVFFQRASNHYVMFILLPNMIFTIMSFGQFLLDLQGGERLAYSVTILLILVAQSLVASSLLPVCPETLWINTFNFWSMLFTMVALLETIIGFWILARVPKREVVHLSDHLSPLGQSSPSPAQPSRNRGELSIKCNTFGDVELDQQDDEQSEVSDRPNPASSCRTQKSNASFRMRKSYQSIKQDIARLTSEARSPKELEAKLNSLDRIFVVLVPSVYIIFLITMFASNHSWEDPKIAEEPDKFAAWIY